MQGNLLFNNFFLAQKHSYENLQVRYGTPEIYDGYNIFPSHSKNKNVKH